jgi:Fur family transcriptional regulator, ferric uptake regulator
MSEKDSKDTRTLIDEFGKFLHARGLRITSERQDILDHIFATHTHFEAEDLQIRLREVGHRVSKATIYRTLKLLVESGILRVTMSHPDATSAQYELVHGLERIHEHLYCEDCGQVFELSNPAIMESMRKQAETMGFSLVDLNVRLSGRCRELHEKGTCSRSGRTLPKD